VGVATLRGEGVCVRHWDWSETSQTVSILTREFGLLRGLAKGARREKGAFSGGIELLTLGQVQALMKSRSSLATLTSWDLLEPFRGVRESLGAFYAGMYAADLVGHLVLDDDPHADLFDALVRLLNGLGRGEPVRGALLEFQWSLLAAVGSQPELDRDVRTGGLLPNEGVLGYSPELGGFVGSSSSGAVWRVRGETRAVLVGVRDGRGAGGDEVAVERAVRLLASAMHAMMGEELSSAGLLLGFLSRDAGVGRLNS
jgi:DNA repair protein RecO (recombination protein O)